MFVRYTPIESPCPLTCKTRMPLTSEENLHELGIQERCRRRPRAGCLDVANEGVDLASFCLLPFCMWSALGGTLETELCPRPADQSCPVLGTQENSLGGA